MKHNVFRCPREDSFGIVVVVLLGECVEKSLRITF